jgi:hypothetical protein
MGTAWRFGAIAAFAVAAAVACGPIEYVNEVTRKASNDVAAAEAVANENDAHYVYWFTLAREYLHQAREEAAAADYQAANRFGRKASFAARKAKESALRSAADPSSMVRPLDVGPDDTDGFSDLDDE